MSIEEAIKHCEEVAEENTKACDRSICFQNKYNNIECDDCKKALFLWLGLGGER